MSKKPNNDVTKIRLCDNSYTEKSYLPPPDNTPRPPLLVRKIVVSLRDTKRVREHSFRKLLIITSNIILQL